MLAARNSRSFNKKMMLGFTGILFFILFTLGTWFFWHQTRISSLQLLVHLAHIDKQKSISTINYSPLRNRIQSQLASYGGDYGIYVEDLMSGSQFGIQADKAFQAASVIKVPLVLFLYALALDERIDLNEEVTMTKGDIESGTGDLKTNPIGTTYPLRRLAKHAIEDSDNTATNMLMRRLGRSNFYIFLRIAGANTIPLGRGKGNITCARDAGLYFKGVWVLRELHPEYGQEIFQFLLNSKFNDRIPAGLPGDVNVANKIGSQVDVVNDAAIVLLDERPYILAVLSSHLQEQRAVSAIAHISRMVFEFQRTHLPELTPQPTGLNKKINQKKNGLWYVTRAHSVVYVHKPLTGAAIYLQPPGLLGPNANLPFHAGYFILCRRCSI